MNTDELIGRLAQKTEVVPSRALERRIGMGVLAGSAASLAFIAVGLGVRPDIATAVHGFSFWMKCAYTMSLAAGAIGATAALARPESADLRWFSAVLLAPCAALAIVAMVQMAATPVAAWPTMWLGASWKACPWLILGLSIPIFLGLLWSFRRLAPTRLRAAGAAAGFSAGAWAAALYCLHCPEVSALFVLTWYTLGIGLAAGLGALVGPRVLRW